MASWVVPVVGLATVGLGGFFLYKTFGGLGALGGSASETLDTVNDALGNLAGAPQDVVTGAFDTAGVALEQLAPGINYALAGATDTAGSVIESQIDFAQQAAAGVAGAAYLGIQNVAANRQREKLEREYRRLRNNFNREYARYVNAKSRLNRRFLGTNQGDVDKRRKSAELILNQLNEVGAQLGYSAIAFAPVRDVKPTTK
jgi:hypothetical protein